MKTVYGPVPSWRLGKSLGVDPVCRVEKTCSFDCVYCQLGKTKIKTSELRDFVEKKQFKQELNEALKRAEADVITFSGSGEPTLAKNLGELRDIVREESGLPLAIITNSSLFNNKQVLKAIEKFDIVVAKLDAGNEKLFKEINNPAEGIEFADVLKGIKNFRKAFRGKKFAIQSMFFDKNRDATGEISFLANEINPDEIQINTPLRPCAVKPLSRQEIEKIKAKFRGLNAVSVYDAEKPEVNVLDIKETKARRPVI